MQKGILTPLDEWYIQQKINKEPKNSLHNLRAEASAMNSKPISKETIRRTLRNHDFNGKISRRKPFISKVNRKKELEFAKKYVCHSSDFWKNVIWSDESKFNVFASDKKQIVWRKANTALNSKNLSATVKHGGVIII